MDKTKWLGVADILDAFRVVPRILLFATGYLVWDVVQWLTLLETPNTEQSALVVTITAIIPAVIGLYQASGRKRTGDSE